MLYAPFFYWQSMAKPWLSLFCLCFVGLLVVIWIFPVPFFVMPDDRMRIVFMGDSLTEGFGLEAGSAYPERIQQKLAAHSEMQYQVINAGISGETAYDGLLRLEPLLEKPVKLFMVAFGTNDGLGRRPIAAFEANLRSILHRVRERYPAAIIVVANPGDIHGGLTTEYWQAFDQVFIRVAKDFNALHLPALLSGVTGHPEYLLPGDPYHPNEAGQALITETVWQLLEPALKSPDSPQL